MDMESSLQAVSPTWVWKDPYDDATNSCPTRIVTGDGLLSTQVTIPKTLQVEIATIDAVNAFAELSGYGYYNLYRNGNVVNLVSGREQVGVDYKVTGGSSAPHFSGGGVLAGLQLVDLNWMSSDQTIASTNGEWMLDNSFPYSSQGMVMRSSATFEETDSPHFMGIAVLTADTSFDTYIMYRPDAATGSDWIPLKKFLWTWNTSMTTFATDGEPRGTQPYDVHWHPEWDHTFSNR